MINPDLLDIIGDYNLWWKDLDSGIDRVTYVEDVIRSFGVPGIVVSISGVRRAGKTFISRQVIKRIAYELQSSQTLIINFEDPSLAPFLDVDNLDAIYATYRHYHNPEKECLLVLDEISNVVGWEKWVRRLLETGEKVKIIVTGSSSKIMADDMASVLTGRFLNIRVYPLSFKEFKEFRSIENNVTSNDRSFHEYLKYGGMPTVVLTQDETLKKRYLKELFDSIITKDVAIKNNVRNIPDLKRTAVLLLSSISSPISATKMTKNLNSMGHKVSSATINDFFHYLTDALLYHFVPIFSYKVKDQLQYPRKLYCVDNGLVNAVSFKMSENHGLLAENAVAIELLRRHDPATIFYWRGSSGIEVDFAIVADQEVQRLYQVSWDITDEKTRDREVKALREAMAESGCKDAVILTYKPAVEKIDGIKVKDIADWLSEDDGTA